MEITITTTKIRLYPGEITKTKLKCEVPEGPTMVVNSAGLVD